MTHIQPICLNKPPQKPRSIIHQHIIKDKHDQDTNNSVWLQTTEAIFEAAPTVVAEEEVGETQESRKLRRGKIAMQD